MCLNGQRGASHVSAHDMEQLPDHLSSSCPLRKTELVPNHSTGHWKFNASFPEVLEQAVKDAAVQSIAAYSTVINQWRKMQSSLCHPMKCHRRKKPTAQQ